MFDGLASSTRGMEVIYVTELGRWLLVDQVRVLVIEGLGWTPWSWAPLRVCDGTWEIEELRCGGCL